MLSMAILLYLTWVLLPILLPSVHLLPLLIFHFVSFEINISVCYFYFHSPWGFSMLNMPFQLLICLVTKNYVSIPAVRFEPQASWYKPFIYFFVLLDLYSWVIEISPLKSLIRLNRLILCWKTKGGNGFYLGFIGWKASWLRVGFPRPSSSHFCVDPTIDLRSHGNH